MNVKEIMKSKIAICCISFIFNPQSHIQIISNPTVKLKENRILPGLGIHLLVYETTHFPFLHILYS